MFGSNLSEEAYFLQQGLGISMPQASAMLKIFGPGGTGIKGLQNTLGISASQMQNADWSKIGLISQLSGLAQREVFGLIGFLLPDGNTVLNLFTVHHIGNLQLE